MTVWGEETRIGVVPFLPPPIRGVLKLKNAYCLASLCEASGRMGEETKWGRVVFPVSIGTSPPSSVVVNTQGRESGGSGLETCSVAVPSAAPLWYGPEHLG